MKILIVGATGMLGHRLFLSLSKDHSVWGTVRSRSKANHLIDHFSIDPEKIIENISVDDLTSIQKVVKEVKPDLVVNCIGVIKQKKEGESRTTCIKINSLFPHQLAEICSENDCRMIHFSTDCVFDGRKGDYSEEDFANAGDLYGRSKLLGEVDYLPNVLTIRTSIIGREISGGEGLVEWFLSQKGKKIKGYSKAIFSGLPTAYFSHLISDYLLKNTGLHGLYHVSVSPIDKYSLLKMTLEELRPSIEIEKDENFTIDRSLNSKKFQDETGWSPPSWSELIKWVGIDNEFYESIKLN